MGELGALFNPGMRHELEERRAKAARREEEGNARDGDLRIDLESGVAVINAPGEGDETDRGSEPAVQSAAESAAGSDRQPIADQEGPPDSAEPAESAEPAPLRPRGKRAMSAARR